ncbi:unnamed protein product [Rhizoctonia solani]|uniref:Uncharacterized protein n=1 Tax=Rhizoctonia solani TaxID=456999 RepID=A0A8H2XY84_9AGAM|nr:unnamed protein product [Rhizoctonia solani]
MTHSLGSRSPRSSPSNILFTLFGFAAFPAASRPPRFSAQVGFRGSALHQPLSATTDLRPVLPKMNSSITVRRCLVISRDEPKLQAMPVIVPPSAQLNKGVPRFAHSIIASRHARLVQGQERGSLAEPALLRRAQKKPITIPPWSKRRHFTINQREISIRVNKRPTCHRMFDLAHEEKNQETGSPHLLVSTEPYESRHKHRPPGGPTYRHSNPLDTTRTSAHAGAEPKWVKHLEPANSYRRPLALDSREDLSRLINPLLVPFLLQFYYTLLLVWLCVVL